MTALVSDSTAASARAALGRFLVHTYERVGEMDGGEYPDGSSMSAPGIPTVYPCKYSPDDRVRYDEGGATVASTPTIKVSAGDPLKPGDQVQNIRNSKGVILATGPYRVGPRTNGEGFGVTLQRRYSLAAATPAGVP